MKLVKYCNLQIYQQYRIFEEIYLKIFFNIKILDLNYIWNKTLKIQITDIYNKVKRCLLKEVFNPVIVRFEKKNLYPLRYNKHNIAKILC